MASKPDLHTFLEVGFTVTWAQSAEFLLRKIIKARNSEKYCVISILKEKMGSFSNHLISFVMFGFYLLATMLIASSSPNSDFKFWFLSECHLNLTWTTKQYGKSACTIAGNSDSCKVVGSWHLAMIHPLQTPKDFNPRLF